MTQLSMLSVRVTLAALAVTVSGFSSQMAIAQSGSDDAEWDVRVYRVTDLVLPRPDYPYGAEIPTTGSSLGTPSVFGGDEFGGGFGSGGFGGGGGGGFGGGGGGFFQVSDEGGFAMGSGGLESAQSGLAGADAGARFTIDDLIEAIQTTIEPASWDILGGNAVCTPLGGMLIIKQTPPVHDQIDALLTSIRNEGGSVRTVTVQAYWLLLNDLEVRELVGDSDRALATVDRDMLKHFVELHQGYQGRITCFSDQTVHLVSGQRRSAALSAVPVVSASAIGFQPVISIPNVGVLLEVKPTLLTDDETAVLNLISTVTSTGSAAESITVVSQTSEGTVSSLQLDRLNMDTQSLATTVRIPLGQPVLVGGLSMVDPQSRMDDERTGTGQLYLVVELTAD